MAYKTGKAVGRMRIKNPSEVLGINDREAQSEVSRYLYETHLSDLMKTGVSFEDPATTVVEFDVSMGKDVWVESNTGFRGNTKLQNQIHIGAGSQIKNGDIGSRL